MFGHTLCLYTHKESDSAGVGHAAVISSALHSAGVLSLDFSHHVTAFSSESHTR